RVPRAPAAPRGPLESAERALSDEHRFRSASTFNRISQPLTRLALGGGLNPLETGEAALRSLLLLHHFPQASVRERRALRAYREVAARHPDASEAREARAQVARLDAKLAQARADAALESARTALARGRFQSALELIGRAERAVPDLSEASALRREAEASRDAHER